VWGDFVPTATEFLILVISTSWCPTLDLQKPTEVGQCGCDGQDGGAQAAALGLVLDEEIEVAGVVLGKRILNSPVALSRARVAQMWALHFNSKDEKKPPHCSRPMQPLHWSNHSFESLDDSAAVRCRLGSNGSSL
jgi:hypothetical protein